MTLDAFEIYKRLVESPAVNLADLTRDYGIYALRDHDGEIRYIGITLADAMGFRGRIYDRHVTGSEGRSHKFSQAYNTGRMYRAAKDSRPDARLAKSLRKAFVRRHCRASIVVVAPDHHPDLPSLELAVQALASPAEMAWGSKRAFDAVPEPAGLVDELLDVLAFSQDQRLAVERQAALHLVASTSSARRTTS